MTHSQKCLKNGQVEQVVTKHPPLLHWLTASTVATRCQHMFDSHSVDNAMSHKENWKTEKAYIFGKVTEEPFIK